MDWIRAVSDHLFSDLEKKQGYPYENDIREALNILKGKSANREMPNYTDPEESPTFSGFLRTAAAEAMKELSKYPGISADTKKISEEIEKVFSDESITDEKEKDRIILKLFHPESGFFSGDRTKGVEELRRRRKIKISRLNSSPVSDPSKEIIFTSNFILTVPVSEEMLEKSKLSDELKNQIKSIMNDRQDYWFDHPVPIGIPEENNELIYGLKNLAETLEYEESKGTCPDDSRLTVIISVSVTHEKLKNILHRYMKEELGKASDFKNLDIYLFTENDTESLINDVLAPAAEKKGIKNSGSLKKVFGVDGEYGRHYSFLKAISPLWQLLSDPDKKGTFKIDLDQVFPEKELVNETGKSAFQHFMTPLWGAEGTDWKGRKTELGMIAGSLVNEKDINKSIFEPDVPYPEKDPEGEDRIFFKQYPMALSTEAEMNLRSYNSSGFCQMRYHVTGGTNGILNKALRKHRPFTPTFIGRAEDQGYILSVLFSTGREDLLRYLHQPGLKMRHDKEAFISEAIKTAETGTYIGDLVRILAFSSYAGIIEGSIDSVKEETDPFTGSFISRIPSALVLFKLLMHINGELDKDKSEPEKYAYVEKLVSSAAHRLTAAFNLFKNSEKLKPEFEKEKEGWNLFYDILDFIESENAAESDFAEQIKKAAEKIFGTCRL